MRTLALAAALAAGLSIGGVAAARTWTDPNGRIVLDVPADWVVSVEAAEPFTYVIAGNANNECQFVAAPNANSATAQAYLVRRTAATDDQFTEALWMQLANSMTPIFRRAPPTFVSRSRDDTGFWPVQRAEFLSGERPVHAGLQLRPGMDIRGFCLTYGGADPTATYDRVLRDMGHPNDATYRADAERQASEREAAATAAPAPAPAPEPEQRNNRRRN